MRGFGWIRLACLLLVLTVLVRVGDTGAEARSLAARVPDGLSFAPEEPEEGSEGPVFRRWTEPQISSLQDVSEEALRAGAESRSADPLTRAATKQTPPPREEALASPPSEPPVFYRPADPGAPADAGPVCGDLRGAPEGGRIVFPLERQFFSSYEDTWGAPRTQGGHEGTDLMAPSGSPEYAITDGTVVPVAGSDADGWNTLGGNAVMLRADYSIGPVQAGDLFYYAHLERESPLEIGTRVRAGQVIGYAGDTGQGPPGTSGLFPPHLHLGWYDGTGGREDAPSGAMNPYPLLEWVKSNGGAVAGGSEARFCEAPRTGPPTPSAHDGDWPASDKNPDLDTAADNPKPDRVTQDAAGDHKKKAHANEPTSNKPPRPEEAKKAKAEPPTKPPDQDRPAAPKPDRPGADRQGPARPDSGADQQTPQKPDPPEKIPPTGDPPDEDPTGPTGSQYEPSTAGLSDPVDQPRPKELRPDAGREPKASQGSDAEDGEDARKPSGRDS